MKRAKELKQRFLVGFLALALGLGVFGAGFSASTFVSHAETQVKITAPKGVNVRQNATTSSARVAGAENGQVLTVISEVQDASGMKWYQVQLPNNVTGYVRSDLVEVVAGTATPEPQAPETPVTTVVTEVNPVSATVAGDSGKIYSDASTESSVVAESVPAETVLTVSGYTDASDGRRWYQASYIANSIQIEGFIREDNVSLSGELVPPTEEPSTSDEPQKPDAEKADYEVFLDNGVWRLADYTQGTEKIYPIKEILGAKESNTEIYNDNQNTIKNQKIIIIILVFLLVAAAAGIAFLVFKIRDMMDSAYYSEVENETLRRKSAANQSGQKVMHTVGTDKQQRPAGAKPAGSGQSQRPSGTSQGQRPAGSTQGQRPSGTSQGQRPSGSVQGQRPAGSTQGQRPAGSAQGQRPSGTSQSQRSAGSAQDQRPAESAQGQQPAGTSQRQRPAGSTQGTRTGQPQQGSAQRTQPKNFLEEDDEFEFEFLNYSGDDEE